MHTFCTITGCYEVAIGAARSRQHCRAHYRSEILANATDLVTCEVVAGVGSRGESAGVTDAVTNETVRQGGTVVLDPRETNVAALVAGGTVRVIKADQSVKATKKG